MDNSINILFPGHKYDGVEPVSIYTAGHYKLMPNHYIHRKRGEIASEAIIIYCNAGQGWLETEGTKYTILPGMMIFCDKGVPHSYGANKEDPWEIYWAHFGGDFAEYFSDRTSLTNLAATVRLNDMDRVIPYMKAMVSAATDNRDELRRLAAYTALRMALIETISQILNPSETILDGPIKKGITYVKEHIHKNLDLDTLTEYVGMSKYHFIRVFKKQVGQTPIQYLTSLKMEEAKRLLMSSEVNINEISDLLGYNNPFYFSECFKKYYGFSPRNYRKRHQKHY